VARFVLQPCHLRDNRFAPTKGSEPVVLDWKSLREKLAPSGERAALMNLRGARIGCFVGLIKDPKNLDGRTPRNFMLMNLDRSARLDWLLKKDPSFETRLLEVYRVEDVRWDSVVEEFGTPELPPWEQR
jgi:hypothetical protein